MVRVAVAVPLRQFIGRFELVEHLASGGMGQVYLARSRGPGGFERHVVIKSLDTTEEDHDMVTMFLDEARLLGTLHHHYIIPVYEVGCDDEGCLYLVMDYVPGESAATIFRTCVERRRPIPMGLALSVGSAIATALAYVHAACSPDGASRAIVHRDVSPSNILVGHDGSVKLIDFGIAKAANRGTRTVHGALKGKLGYLAPEQILDGSSVDRRTDIFALGVVLYELTCGRRAFQDASDLITFERIIRGDVAPPSTVVRGYSLGLERIVMRAMAVARDDRYQDAGELAADLDAFARSHGVPFGHAAIADAMTELFRRHAHLASDSSTDLGVQIADIDATPVSGVLIEFDEGYQTMRTEITARS